MVTIDGNGKRLAPRYVIRVLDFERPTWLKSYDPHGDPPGAMPYRTGRATMTGEKSQAMTFGSYVEALGYYQQVHPDEPTRSTDGKPNRPLTAYTVSIEGAA